MYEEPKVGEIKSFLLTNLVEIIAKVSSVEDDKYELSEAFAISAHQVADPNDPNKVGVRPFFTPMSIFAQYYSKTGGLDIPLYKSNILWIDNPPEEMGSQYAAQTGSILTPQRKIQSPR